MCMKTTKRLILVGYTVLLSLVSTTPTPVFSQIPIQSTNIQLGMKYYSLIRYHGEPIKKDFSGDFTIALYNVVIDLVSGHLKMLQLWALQNAPPQRFQFSRS